MRVKRRFLTLMEILIVLFILGIGTVAIGFRVKEAYEEQRFLSEVDQVVGDLQLAQELMLLTDNDVYFKVRANESENAIEYWIETNKPLAPSSLPGTEKRITHALKKKLLHGMRGVFFDPPLPSADNELDILFRRGGTSEGKVILAPKTGKDEDEDESRNYHIYLWRYPRPIESTIASKEPPTSDENQQAESERLFPVLKDIK